jgi:hypothetical protein
VTFWRKLHLARRCVSAISRDWGHRGCAPAHSRKLRGDVGWCGGSGGRLATSGMARALCSARGEADEPATSVAARAKTSSLKPRDLHEWCDVAITYCSLPEFPAQLCSLYTPWTISPGCTRYRQPPFGVRSDTHKRSRARTGCCRKQARSTPRSC